MSSCTGKPLDLGWDPEGPSSVSHPPTPGPKTPGQEKDRDGERRRSVRRRGLADYPLRSGSLRLSLWRNHSLGSPPLGSGRRRPTNSSLRQSDPRTGCDPPRQVGSRWREFRSSRFTRDSGLLLRSSPGHLLRLLEGPKGHRSVSEPLTGPGVDVPEGVTGGYGTGSTGLVTT